VQTPESIKRKDAMKGLINIAMMEGAVLMLVVGAYLYTDDLNILIGGVAGTAIVFGAMTVRWFNESKAALKPASDEGAHG
jgi:hypothetical protein